MYDHSYLKECESVSLPFTTPVPKCASSSLIDTVAATASFNIAQQTMQHEQGLQIWSGDLHFMQMGHALEADSK